MFLISRSVCTADSVNKQPEISVRIHLKLSCGKKESLQDDWSAMFWRWGLHNDQWENKWKHHASQCKYRKISNFIFQIIHGTYSSGPIITKRVCVLTMTRFIITSLQQHTQPDEHHSHSNLPSHSYHICRHTILHLKRNFSSWLQWFSPEIPSG